MLTVEEAQKLVLQHARRLPPVQAELSSSLLGHVLAEDVVSDIDMPPYDKSLMDGYAIRAADFVGATSGDAARVLAVIEEIPAGRLPQKTLAAGQASRIMTGAALPPGADAVVMVERTEALDDRRVRILDRSVKPEQNVLRQGRELKRSDVVLTAGSVLRPQELGLLATVGKTSLKTYRQPLVALLSTGDEVVEPVARPAPGQIRNSNAAMLMGQIARAGCKHEYLGIARDTVESLRESITAGLRCDFLLLSGGVSAGKFDLVPEVLKELGVQPIFHHVAMKPGKPLYFGVRGDALVFGLPGNPVSSMVGFELFVRPALRVALGKPDSGPRQVAARMTLNFHHKSDRPTYHPARLQSTDDGWRVTPVPWFGSPDLRAVTQANAFAVFAAGEHDYRVDETVQVLAPEMED